MDRFGIGNIGLTGFGVGEFRLPVFGGSGSGNGGQGNAFHESIVDAWFMSGYANGDSPASIRGVKGNELQLRNFAYALDSGFGKYNVNFTKYIGSNTTSNSISIYKEAGIDKGYATITYNQLASDIPSYFIEIKGLDSGDVLYYYRNNEGLEKNVIYNKDGMYELPMCYKEGTQGTSAGFTIRSINKITITQLPSAYEGALVFDGVDDYGICTGLPILDDYTVICRREFKKESVSSKRNVSNNTGAFVSESIINNKEECYSYGVNNAITIDSKDSVTYITSTNYNGQPIKRGIYWDDNDFLLLGASYLQNDKAVGFMQGAIYYFALYNKSLTIEEIETEKAKLENMWDSKLNKS